MNICIFGAASSEISHHFMSEAEKLGYTAAKRGHDLVFGAGAHGLMGASAKGFFRGGGKITGVIPRFFRDEDIEQIYPDCNKLIYTETMQERKFTMETLADAFIVVPGGIGTFEEFFEILTLKQLGRHKKPIAIYNTDGYYNNLSTLLDNAIKLGFLRSQCKKLYIMTEDLDELFSYVEDGAGPELDVHDLKNG